MMNIRNERGDITIAPMDIMDNIRILQTTLYSQM